MMLGTRLLIAASVAALLGAAPLIAQDMQQPGAGNQQSQSDQTLLKKKKGMNQQQGQNTGQATGNQQKMQSQAAGEQGQSDQYLKKKKGMNQQGQNAGQQQMQNQAAGEQGQPNQPNRKLKKSQQATGGQNQQPGNNKLQQNTQNEQTGQQGQPAKKLKKQGQMTGQSTTRTQTTKEMTTGATGKMATEIPAEKRTVIRQKLVSTNVQRVSRDRISVNLSVGVRVPRTIHFYPVPTEVVKLVPAYRGYLYFVLDDGTIVIVQPNTYEVVYVLTA